MIQGPFSCGVSLVAAVLLKKISCFTIRNAKGTYLTIARNSSHEEPLEKMSTFAPYGNNITGTGKSLDPQVELLKNDNRVGGRYS
jgi:hypothetical protein